MTTKREPGGRLKFGEGVALYNKAKAFVAKGSSTIAACKKAGISNSTYSYHRSKDKKPAALAPEYAKKANKDKSSIKVTEMPVSNGKTMVIVTTDPAALASMMRAAFGGGQ